MELIDAINAELPQFQCGRCDTPGCGPYAKAISEGSPHNRCVPGGQETLDRLSILLKRDNLSLDDDYGPGLVSQTAVVIEEDCIGCKKCIDACPVDAIVGASNLMHSVLDDICTGCELCVEPCPVDCISMVEVSENQSDRARSSSSEYFDLKNLLSSRNLTKAKLNKNVELNQLISLDINVKITNRSVDQRKEMLKLQTDLLESQKSEKLLDAEVIDDLINKLKH